MPGKIVVYVIVGVPGCEVKHIWVVLHKVMTAPPSVVVVYDVKPLPGMRATSFARSPATIEVKTRSIISVRGMFIKNIIIECV